MKKKIDKDNSGKKNKTNHKKRVKKTMWGNTVAIYNVLKRKKTTNLNSQPTPY
jgi:hypothetical protein